MVVLPCLALLGLESVALMLGMGCSPGNDSDKGLRVRESRWVQVERAPGGVLSDVFFLDEKHGWVVGPNGRIALTTDSGFTWEDLTGKAGDSWWRGAWFLDRNHGFLVGGLKGPEGGLPARIVTTEDGGRTWKDQTPGHVQRKPAAFDRIQFLSAAEGFIFGDRLLATKDAGRSWSVIGKDTVSGVHAMFSSPQVGWQVDSKNLLKTTDGGKTWEPTSARDALTEEERVQSGLIRVHFRNDLIGWAMTYGSRFLRTEDGGLTWKDLGKIRPGAILSAILTDSSHGWVLVQDDRIWHVLRTTDGGKNWQESHKSDRPLTGLFFLREDLGWAVGDGTVLRYGPDP